MYVKKIIGGICIVVTIIIVCVIAIILKNKLFLSVTNKDTYIEEQNVVESENIIENQQEENKPVEEIKTDMIPEQEKTNDYSIATPTEQEKTNKSETKKYDKNSISIMPKEEKTTNETKANAKQNESTIPNQETIQNTIPKTNQENKQETIKKDTPKNIKSYVRNTAMENKMKVYIENNPSEYMLQYGFVVKEDPSIVNDTTEFTYTEIRIKAKIKNKFGTIKIYAQDVLLDGVYQFTECFIL